MKSKDSANGWNKMSKKIVVKQGTEREMQGQE